MTHDTHDTSGSSELIEAHLPCPDCGSSDALALYSDGWMHCFACNVHKKQEGFSATDGHGKKMTSSDDQDFKDETKPLLDVDSSSGIKARHISAEACRRLGYGYGTFRDQKVHVAQEYDTQGKLIGQKLRTKTKEFIWLGSPKKAAPLWGMKAWSVSHSQREGWQTLCVITEGEIDALTVCDALGGKRAVVSLVNGADSAEKAMVAAQEWLDRFDKIIIMFDNDGPGRAAAEKAAAKLPVGKAFIATLPADVKDANELAMAGRSAEISRAVWEASPWRPDKVLAGTDLVSQVMDYTEPDGVPWEWKGVRKFLPVMQVPSIITLVAPSGIGKTTFSKAIEHYLLRCGEKLGVLHLEEPPKKTAIGLVGYELKRKLNFGTKGIDREELKDAAQRILTDRLFLYDGFGSVALDVIAARIRYMAGNGCRYIVLDHVSILASGVEGDERKALDVTMTRLRSMCEELNVCLIVVCHLNKFEGDDEGAEITTNHIRGSAGIKQLSDTIISFRRNKMAAGWKSCLTLLTCLKNREWGLEGPMTCLMYQDDGTMVEKPLSAWEAEDADDHIPEIDGAASDFEDETVKPIDNEELPPWEM